MKWSGVWRMAVRLDADRLMEHAGVIGVFCQLANVERGRILQGWADGGAVHISAAFVLFCFFFPACRRLPFCPLEQRAKSIFVFCFWNGVFVSNIMCFTVCHSDQFFVHVCVCVCVCSSRYLCNIQGWAMKQKPWMFREAVGDKPDLQSVTHTACWNVLSSLFSLLHSFFVFFQEIFLTVGSLLFNEPHKCFWQPWMRIITRKLTSHTFGSHSSILK